MRKLSELDQYRDKSKAVIKRFGCTGDDNGGVFWVKSPTDGSNMRIIASNGLGWDHVSVCHMRRVPNWLEMQKVAILFFLDNEACMQLHVPPRDHINLHDKVLHLWRPHDTAIPLPPKEFV